MYNHILFDNLFFEKINIHFFSLIFHIIIFFIFISTACDWRLIAYRVGIPENLVEQWIRMRAPYAMALVMKVWGDSVGATVRMLHRHLASPQMKAIVLAKRLADFYEVD